MLSVAKLGAGQQQYYLDSVAAGADEYYLGAGEQPGQWDGHGARLLALDGEVGSEALRRVLDGQDPSDQIWLTQRRPNRVPGFDLTFSAPKSVSVIYALADEATSEVVGAAHDRAVTATLGWLEREACWTRAGSDGINRLRGEGFVAARFLHRTSRAGDPQLHTHVLVANMTRTPDGRWRALDAKMLLWQAQTAGYLYKAHLRHELASVLGVEWGPVSKGAAEIVGIPRGLLDLFATRRKDIEAELAERGLHSPQAAAVAALETRPAKTAPTDLVSLRQRWRTATITAGYDPDLVNHIGGQPSVAPASEAIEEAIAMLISKTGLTENTTIFDRRALLRAWCAQLPQGAPIPTIEQYANETLTRPEVIKLVGPSRFGTYTTQELVALEQHLTRQAIDSTRGNVAVVSQSALDTALTRRPSLSPEQTAAVTRLVTSGNGIDLLIAAAGTGKTFCLDAAASAWQQSGYRVIGAALAATAAAQLNAQTGIASDTIALRTIQVAEQETFLDRNTVLIVDEAAMAGTRALAPLLDAAYNNATKVVLVGDPKQLDAIQAGGLLAGLARRIEPVTLIENRRQTEPWEREIGRAHV